MYIESCIELGTRPKHHWFDSFSTSYNKTTGGTKQITIYRDITGDSSTRLYVSGGKAQSEDWGFGKHFNGSGTWINDGYERNYTVVTFTGSETSKTVTITMVDNGTLEPNKTLNIWLSNGRGHGQITLIDDRVDYVINVLNPGNVCGHDLSAYALDNTGETNNRNNLQAILNHFKNYHSGANLIIYFPAGYYKFANTAAPMVLVPTVTNRITFVGPTNPTIHPDTDGHAVLYIQPDSTNDRRFFTTAVYGYVWSGSSDDYRVGFLRLFIDGKLYEHSPSQRTSAGKFEQSQALFFSSNGPAYQISCVEACHFRGTLSDAVMAYSYTDTRIYNITGYNCFRGLIVSSPPRPVKLTAKECHGYHVYDGYPYHDWDVSGFDLEPVNTGQDNTSQYVYLEDCSFEQKLQFAPLVCDGYSSYIEGKRITVRNTVNSTNHEGDGLTWTISLLGNKTGTGSIKLSNCDLNGNARVGGIGTIELYQTKITGYTYSGVTTEYVFAPFKKFESNDGVSIVYLEDCSFAFQNLSGGTLPKPVWGVAATRDTDQNDTITLVRPVFDSSLTDGCVYGNVGTYSWNACERIIIDPIINSPGPLFYLQHRDSYTPYPTIQTIKGGTYNNGKFANIYGYNDYDCHKAVVYLNDIVIPKDRNIIETTYGFRRVSFLKDKNLHPSSMTRGTTTTVTCTNHGLQVGDKIMFDAIGITEWKNALCPDANVPLFQVTEVVDANTFRFNYNSSGLSANYDGNSDSYGAFFKPPLRLIIGDPGDNPITEKPAGFAGDLYQAGSTYYRCKTSGVAGSSAWELY